MLKFEVTNRAVTEGAMMATGRFDKQHRYDSDMHLVGEITYVWMLDVSNCGLVQILHVSEPQMSDVLQGSVKPRRASYVEVSTGTLMRRSRNCT